MAPEALEKEEIKALSQQLVTPAALGDVWHLLSKCLLIPTVSTRRPGQEGPWAWVLWFRTVLFKPHCVHECPGDLVRMPILIQQVWSKAAALTSTQVVPMLPVQGPHFERRALRGLSWSPPLTTSLPHSWSHGEMGGVHPKPRPHLLAMLLEFLSQAVLSQLPGSGQASSPDPASKGWSKCSPLQGGVAGA